MVLRYVMSAYAYVLLILPIGGSATNSLSVVRYHVNDKCLFRSASSSLYWMLVLDYEYENWSSSVLLFVLLKTMSSYNLHKVPYDK
jgi:hypothetical protein